ncbi:VOC family protein [Desulfobotulus sp. H1]|uniref:VOC family protein n=1 Tax=Desulfobotulus pelophilus TaxID=2823377 RepID=A0ABT3N9Y4_9BACT|nr:VOC family protein [Desulfobotulus pelophilus]MCW7754273.1 VOC family protein [Desulfobotulus pelophilus]
MISCMDHLNIVVTDLERSLTFFEILGFRSVMTSDLDATFLEKVTGLAGRKGRFVAMEHEGSAMRLELLQYTPPEEIPRNISLATQPGFRHLAFQVEDMEGCVKALKAHHVSFLSPVQTWEKTGKKLVYFLGPDGILMELCQYPDGKR